MLASLQTTKRPCPHGTDKPIHSKKIGRVELDFAKLAIALAIIDYMSGNNAYDRYNLTVDPRKSGTWGQIILRNWSGKASDGLSKEFDGHSKWTEEGDKVPYIRDLVETTFDCEHLKSVRIFLANNAIIAAHRDYMEFKKGFRRLHIPLRTNGNSMNSEGSVVYHMEVGGIYYLDGREAHAGGNLGAESRLHLVLDFCPDQPVASLFQRPERNLAVGEMDFVARPALSDVDLDNLIDGLAGVISPRNYGTVVGLINLLPFTNDFDTAAVYEVVLDVAVRSGKSDVIELARADRRDFLGFE
ncbi:hypothetical protein SBA4_2170012 [Candidatus Sulfopaludibacter sp. SbA4]|nr:hypothetical protein SBA4_2170012 [Candidatus Sulfopaludibacter sp. SbA4]